MGGSEEKKTRATTECENLEPWPEPRPLHDPPLPSFPTSSLPPWLRVWVEAQAQALQVPTDLPAMLSLAVLSTTCAKRFEVKIRQGWIEPTNLYLLVSMASGTRKSVAFDAATAPILAFEIERAKQMKELLATTQVSDKEARLRLVVDAKTVDTSRPKERVVALDARQQLDPCTFVSDATPERVASLLAENAGRLAILSDEGEICSIIAGRYGGSFEVFLKAHSGQVLTIERQGRGRVHTRRPALTLGLAVQPDVLHSLAAKRAVRERGLLARFLVAVPASNVGHRTIAPPPVTDDAIQDYSSRVRTLLEYEDHLDDGELMPATLNFTKEGHDLFIDFETEVELMLREDGVLSAIPSWGSKLPGAVARIAGLLAVAENPTASRPEIGATHVAAATAIGRYAISHALAAFTCLGVDRDRAGAGTIMSWLRKNGVTETSRRDLHQALRGQFQRADELEGPLRLLEAHACLRISRDSARPGRPSHIITVSPIALQDVDKAHHN